MSVIYSLIIPFYNSPERLERLIKTIPIRKDLQIIAVDDCSTSHINLFKILKDKYQYIEWYKTEKNGGAGVARNVGLSHAKGKYLLFADADDYFTPSINDIFNKHRNSCFDIIYFFVNEVDSATGLMDNGLKYRNMAISLYKKSHRKNDVCHISTAPWGKLIRRDIIEKYNIQFQETRISNDVFFSLMTDFYSNDIFAEEIAAYNYSVNQISVSNTGSIDKRLVRLKIDLERNSFLIRHKLQHVYISRQLKDSLSFFFRNVNDSAVKHQVIILCKEYGINRNQYRKLYLLYCAKNLLIRMCRIKVIHKSLSLFNSITNKLV